MSPVIDFVSGASAPADIRGLARWSVPLGISLSEMSRNAVAVLCEHWRMPLLRIFVDSGAFSEMDRAGAAVAPIDDATWTKRVRVMHELAAVFGPPSPLGDYGPRLYVVAPDRVADQRETLRRLALHREAMAACRALGARVVVPIQRGEMTASAFDVACGEALGFDDYVRGIPGNKAAMPYRELEAFLRTRRPCAVHLLGVGRRGRTFEPLTTLVRRVLGDVPVSCDSNALAAIVGRTNGPGGGARRLTEMQDACSEPGGIERIFPAEMRASPRAMAVWMAFGPMHMHELVMESLRARGVVPTLPEGLQMDLFDKVAES
jgi:hypothetical protein